MRRADIGAELDALDTSIRAQVVDLVQQYRRYGQPALLKQAIDTPARTKAQVAAWIARHNAANGAGAGQAFLAACLTAAGSSRTLAQVNAAVDALIASSQTLVQMRSGGATWDDLASATLAAFPPSAPESEDFAYRGLPVPGGYTTVWNEPW